MAEISGGFSKEMAAFEERDAGENKYLALGGYVYRSVAWAIKHALLLRPDEVRYSSHDKFRNIALGLEEIAGIRSSDRWEEFWAAGREASDELSSLFDSEKQKS